MSRNSGLKRANLGHVNEPWVSPFSPYQAEKEKNSSALFKSVKIMVKHRKNVHHGVNQLNKSFFRLGKLLVFKIMVLVFEKMASLTKF